MRSPPSRIETERLVLRCWEASDAPSFKRALDLSLEHLHPWVPWAQREPYAIESVRARIERRRAEFLADEDFDYGLFGHRDSEVIGGAGLYARIGPAAYELGYWIRADLTGRGLATEAARALTRVAFDTSGIERVEMHIDPRNAASLAIPRKLGYRYRETVVSQEAHEVDRTETMIFERTAGDRAQGRADGEPNAV